MTKDALPPTSMPVPPTPRAPNIAPRLATNPPSIPKGIPVPDQPKPTSGFSLPDQVSVTDIKEEGSRRAAMAEGGSADRYGRSRNGGR